jgi:hypothetical protein
VYKFLLLSGLKEDSDSGFTLKPYIGLPGFCVSGAEDEGDYEVYVKMRCVDADAAGVVCGYSEDENYKKRYIEFLLDFANQQAVLNLVIEAEDPQPKNVFTRFIKLDKGKDYVVGVKYWVDPEDNVCSVQCFVNDTVVILFHYIGEVLQRGMWGFKVEGANESSAVFSDVFKAPVGAKQVIDAVMKRVKLTSADLPYPEAWMLLQEAIETVGSELDEALTFETLFGDRLRLVKALAAVYYLCRVTGGVSTGLSFSLGDLTVTPQRVADGTVLFEQLRREVDSLLGKLKQPYVGVA